MQPIRVSQASRLLSATWLCLTAPYPAVPAWPPRPTPPPSLYARQTWSGWCRQRPGPAAMQPFGPCFGAPAVHGAPSSCLPLPVARSRRRWVHSCAWYWWGISRWFLMVHLLIWVVSQQVQNHAIRFTGKKMCFFGKPGPTTRKLEEIVPDSFFDKCVLWRWAFCKSYFVNTHCPSHAGAQRNQRVHGKDG